MRLTNRSGLPEPIVRLVSSFPDRPPLEGAISVTTLLKPPQMVQLEREHYDEIEEDVADRIWAVFGSLTHLAIERIGADNVLQEEQLSSEIDGWTLYGTPDLYDGDGIVTDFKTVSVWQAIDGVKPEWTQQLNCYAWLLRRHGFPVNKVQVCALYRDWSRAKSFETEYPSTQAEMLPVPLIPDSAVESFIRTRLKQHRAARDGVTTLCSAEERWERPTRYAVMPKTTGAGPLKVRRRALRVLESREAAEEWAQSRVKELQDWNDWYEIVVRPGESVRCASWCRVSRWCNQWAAMPK